MQAVPFAELLQALASGAEGPDIIAAASSILRKNISSLARMLTAGAVIAEVCGAASITAAQCQALCCRAAIVYAHWRLFQDQCTSTAVTVMFSTIAAGILDQVVSSSCCWKLPMWCVHNCENFTAAPCLPAPISQTAVSHVYCCQVRLAAVEPGAAATIAAIRSLQPYTMSWSNVPDYMEPAAFHRLARAVSDEVAGTVHFMHSMN
jgi:hypothetical protein